MPPLMSIPKTRVTPTAKRRSHQSPRDFERMSLRDFQPASLSSTHCSRGLDPLWRIRA